MPLVKITGPKLSKVMNRQRLFRRLDHARSHSVIWITGPPGSGKTTLIASYMKSRDLPGLWYQIDSGDADPATFFYYLKLAVDKTAKKHQPSLPLLTPEYQTDLPAFARRYFVNLYKRYTPHFAIVFDNYQNLSNDTDIQYLIREGMENMPQGGNMIVISRTGPPPAFTRMQANRTLLLIDWDDLKFTEDETTVLVHFHSKRKLSEETIRALHRKTGGWAAGVVLMLEYLKKPPVPLTPFDYIERETKETIFSYFQGEIFDRIDRRTKEFLLTTAFLPKMTFKMAEELTGRQGSGRILSKLSSSNYFISMYSAPEPVYQYHDLFLEFLLAKAKELWDPDTIRQVQRRAAKALSDAGQIEDAIHLYNQSGDGTDAARLIISHAQHTVDKGRYRTLETWLLGLPDDMLEKDPWLIYWLGVSRLPFDPPGSINLFEKAYQMFKTQKTSAGIYMSWSAIIETIVFSRSNLTLLDQWIDEFEQLRKQYPEFSSQEIELQAAYGIFIALMFHKPQDPELPLWADKVMSGMLRITDPIARIRFGSNLFLYYSWIGDFFKADSLTDTLHTILRSEDVPPLVRLNGYFAECSNLWLHGSKDDCLRVLKEALITARTNNIRILDPNLLGAFLYTALSYGDIKTGMELLKQMAAATHPSQQINFSHHHYLSGWYSILTGKTQNALKHAEAGLALIIESGFSFPQVLLHLELAYIHAEEGRYRKALYHLNKAHHFAKGMKSIQLEYLYFMTASRYYFLKGNETQALEMLARALTIGRKQGYVITQIMPRSVIADMYNRALNAGIETEYVRDIIRKLNLVPPDQNQPDTENWPWQIKIYTLGRFELIRDGKLPASHKKAQKKPLALLKAIISFGGREVEEGQLTDLLWPDTEGDFAHKALSVNIIRLRKLLGSKNAIKLNNGKVSLDTGYCWVDAWVFEQTLNKIAVLSKEMVEAITGEMRKSKSRGLKKAKEFAAQTQRAIELYRGHFLVDEPDQWSVSFRERLRLGFTKSIENLGMYLEHAKTFKKAIDYYQKGLEVDELSEVYYQRIIVCYLQMGRRAEALSTYNKCKKRLSVYAIEPSPETEALYRKIKMLK